MPEKPFRDSKMFYFCANLRLIKQFYQASQELELTRFYK